MKHKVCLAIAVTFWGIVIISLELLLLPFFLQKQDIRKKMPRRSLIVSKLHMESLR